MKKHFVIGMCYEDCFGQRYVCVDYSCFGTATLIPISSISCEFPQDDVSKFKVVSYEGDK